MAAVQTGDAITKSMFVVSGQHQGTTNANGQLTFPFGVTFVGVPVLVVTRVTAATTQRTAHVDQSATTTTTGGVIITSNDAPDGNISATVNWVAVGTRA